MKRKNDPRSGAARSPVRELPSDVGALLAEIEKEPVPEKLLALAKQLQETLARKRAEEADPARRTGHARQG